MFGEGYTAPLGFIAFALVFAQIIASTGFGSYFLWSVPGLYSAAAVNMEISEIGSGSMLIREFGWTELINKVNNVAHIL